ncbi:MAG: hypothetical protein RI945_217 [Candidatus Parcubacteria bacterium]|jgi:uridine kinase
MKIIGIAGGSGSGKSTFAVDFCKKYSDKCALIHLDDYFKKTEDVNMMGSFKNWDHPQAVDFNLLYKDLLSLKNGEEIKILTKSELYNPHYDHSIKNKIEISIFKKEILLVEGYLAFFDDKIRDLMDLKLYLDIPIEESTKRRSDNKFKLDKEYLEQVLIPMHKEFVEPTKDCADLVLDVSKFNKEEVFALLEDYIINNIN